MADIQKEKLDQQQKKKKRKRIILIALIVCLCLGILGTGTAAFMVYKIVQPVMDLDILNPSSLDLTSYMYDIDGNVVANLHEEQNRIIVTIDQIPEDLQEAFIAIEDERFSEHYGFDLMGIIRAFWANIRNQTIAQGASTITQQYIKLSFLTSEQTYTRKIQEIYLAVKLEQQLSKEEILERYLNKIYFGAGAYGVEAAAKTYLDKSISELNISEMALLAGLIQNHTYTPYSDFERSIERRDLVISKMEELGFISTEEADEAKNFEIQLAERPESTFPYPYFTDYVVHHQLLDILTSLPEYETNADAYEAIYKEGLHIYTTLEPELQNEVAEIVDNPDYYHTTKLDDNGKPQPQAAVVMLDPKTGYIRALAGGRGYNQENQDLRYLSRRQPGSSIKPLVTYGPAIEEGLITPGSAVDDAPIIFGSYAPENYDMTFWGLITVREALKFSRNVPAVRIFHQLGTRVGTQYAAEMGITTFTDMDYEILGTTLGGIAYGIRPLEMAQAYSVFANMGVKIDITAITKIENSEGDVIYEYKPEPERIFSEQTAFLVNDMLQDVINGGTATAIRVGRPLAGKTGTTDSHRDSWLATYAPNIVMVTWQGYDIPEDGRINSSLYQKRMANAVLKEGLEDLPVVNFTRPSGIVGPIAICKKSGLRPSENCPKEDIYYEYFPAGKAPAEECDMHIKVEVCEQSNLLPTEFCPEDSIIEKVFLKPREFITTDYRWRGAKGRFPRDVEDFAPDPEFLQEGQEEEDMYCNIHIGKPPATANITGNLGYSPLQVTLAWQNVTVEEKKDPDGNPLGLAVAGFNVYRNLPGKEPVLLTSKPVKSTEYTDKNSSLEIGKTYIYSVKTVNKQGITSEAKQIEIQITPQPLSAPANLNASYTDEKVKLTWGSVANAAEYYIYRRNESDSFIKIGSADATQYNDDSISFSPGQIYQYQIKAKGNNGQLSNPAGINICIPEESPQPPVGLNAALEGTNITLSWNAPGGGPQPAKYYIYRKKDSGDFTKKYEVSAPTLSYTDDNLSAGTYTYKVSSVSSEGTESNMSSPSGTIGITPPATSSLFNLFKGVSAPLTSLFGLV